MNNLPQPRFWRQVFPELALIWATRILIGSSIAVNLAASEAMWVITLAALVALSSGWGNAQLARRRALQAQQMGQPPGFELAGFSWQQFVADLMLGVAQLTATAAAVLELVQYGMIQYGLSQSRQLDLIWLVPTGLAAVFSISLMLLTSSSSPADQSSSIKPKPRRLAYVRLAAILAAILIVGPIGAKLFQLIDLQPAKLTLLSQAVNQNLNVATLLQSTALIAAAYAGYDSKYLSRQHERNSFENSSAIALRSYLKLVYLALKAMTVAILLGWAIFLITALGNGINSAAVNSTTINSAAVNSTTINSTTINSTTINSTTINSVSPTFITQLTSAGSQALGGSLSLVNLALSLSAIITLLVLLLTLLPQLSRQWSSLIADHLSPAAVARTDLPRPISRSDLVWVSTALCCLLLVGDIETIWMFSAFAFLIHSALVQWNLLRLMQWRAAVWQSGFNACRLALCLSLAFWVDWTVWLVSLGLIALCLVWRGMVQWSDNEEV
jgi:hypothetical protein